MSTNDTDIVKLNLNDTFYDWYLRTNQIIDYVNPINVYDVFAGAGLQESRSGTPGTIELTVGTNVALYAVGTLTNSNGNSEVILDYSALTTQSVGNTSIFSFQNSGDQIYKVEASDMLPPDINGNHAFGGIITVADLIVDDGTITLNNTGTSRDNCGLIIESVSDTNSQNVSFLFDNQTDAWYSSEYLGVKSGKGFVTDSFPKAIFPFIATQSQGQVDLRLQTTIGSVPEYFSIQGTFDSSNAIKFAHYYNNALVNDILELTSSSTNGSSVIVKDTITITDILNSTPFAQSPEVTSVPITDNTDGFLSTFVNRVVVDAGSVSVGDVVRMGTVNLELADPNNLNNAQVLGIVEKVSKGFATVITSGPFNNISGLTSLTVGSVYYLDPVNPGAVTSVNPQNTNGILDVPVFIATSTTGGVIVPDFASYGTGGTIVTGGGTINNAFSTVTVTGGGGTATASGESTLQITGGTNISSSIAGSTLTINCDIPESSTANQLLRRNNSNAYEWFTPSNYSVISRSLTGNIDSVQLTPGTILGRRDDTDDTDNPVQALTGTQVLDILGFTGNSYIKTITFETGTGVPEHTFDAETSEAVNIRAGANITFDWDGSDLYINSTGEGSTNVGAGSLEVAKEGVKSELTNILVFEDDYSGAGTSSSRFIEFAVRHTTGNQAIISAKPTTQFLRITADNTVIGGYDCTSGRPITFTGGNSITTAYDAGRQELNISLDNTIIIDKIISRLNTGTSGLILSGGDDGGRNTLRLMDGTRVENASFDESTIVINAWDTYIPISGGGDTTRISTQAAAGVSDKAVTIYADSNGTQAGSLKRFTYPFRFFKIIVDEIECNNFVANEALKLTERLDTVVGTNTTDPYATSECAIEYRTNTQTLTGGSPSGANGVTFKFKDDDLTQTNSIAYLHFPSGSRMTTLNAALPKSTLMMVDNLMFGTKSSASNFSPTISRGVDNGKLSINSHATVSVELTLDANNTGTGKLGTLTDAASANSYTYLNHLHGADTTSLRLKRDTELDANTFAINNGTNGIKFNPTPSNNAGGSPLNAAGQLLYVSSLSAGGVMTVQSRFIIKPLSTQDGNDPINTLYYSI